MIRNNNKIIAPFGLTLGLSLGLILVGFLSLGLNPTALYRYPFNGYMTLAGTFGELRKDHFHSGIDIKTLGKTGIPVYAVQDGYLYRAKVSPFGFGNAVYLRHPDGRFSVYAHLSQFTDPVEDYIYERQYASKQFTQELYPDRNKFVFNQGDIIGYSGNSGSSVGPHLHFEIRDPQENILNSLIYYKHLVKDNIKPTVQEIAFEPIDLDSRVQGEFKKHILTPTGTNGHYTVPGTIDISGRVGIEYRAFDLLNGARNHCGINQARLYLDDNLVYEMDLGKFSFDEKRYINVHIDYQYYKRTKKRFEKAYVDTGNKFSAYQNLNGWGMIDLGFGLDEQLHPFRLELSDGFGNQSTVTGNLRLKEPFNPLGQPPAFSAAPKVSHEIRRNVLVLTAESPTPSMMDGIAYLNPAGEGHHLKPTYTTANKLVFLQALNKSDYPVEIRDPAGTFRIETGLKDELFPNRNNLVEEGELQVYFPFESVFSNTHLTIKKQKGDSRSYTDVYEIGNEEIPILNSFLVSFKPSKRGNKSHMVVAKKEKGKWEFAGNTWGEDNNLYASTRSFGEFCVMADSVPPLIQPTNFSNGKYIAPSQSTLRIKLDDAFSGINSKGIYCTLDGEWLLFAYDNKKETITHKIANRPAPGTYNLEVNVYDEAGNLKTKSYQLSF